VSKVLLLSAEDVERLLTPAACLEAVEEAFRQLAHGDLPAPAVLGLHAAEGSFHLKAGLLGADRPYFAVKVNANFPGNGARHGLPTIQGVVYLCDGGNGLPLAVMDSSSITALRTAAASAVAAKHCARRDCETALLCGCGAQAMAQLRALHAVRAPKRWLAYDADAARAAAFSGAASAIGVAVQPVSDLGTAVTASRLVVTCTTATRYFVTQEMVAPGTFIAAVGADSEGKQEIEPALLARARVVTDLTAQATAIGDLHHAIAAGLMTREDVHAELGEVVAGLKPGRTRADEIFVFDSTGTGLQDVAAAIAAYRGAAGQAGQSAFDLAGRAA
jgi:ornithine cyclodeaminase/alanine dehydrogenase-like protein (mu-crystallin family)